jgi:hypothetical protein
VEIQFLTKAIDRPSLSIYAQGSMSFGIKFGGNINVIEKSIADRFSDQNITFLHAKLYEAHAW